MSQATRYLRDHVFAIGRFTANVFLWTWASIALASLLALIYVIGGD